uniref:Uncharacterized protein n=2 Tax=Brassica oleracea TaxID=3712 RepID=A0A0D3C0P0_BRAOL|nr:unnamed protein product [Brassica oleracea]
MATCLLDPFLETSEDQIAKDSNSASWFTKGTIQRFVRILSNPGVLRTCLQFKEALTVGSSHDSSEDKEYGVAERTRTKTDES